MTQTPHAVLIDGSGLIHRAWANAPREQNRNGAEIGATRLFGKMVLKLLHRMNKGAIPPTHVGMFFDPAHEGGWRRQISAAYKADRPEKDADLLSQYPMIREMCEAMGIKSGLCDTHEADDMIAAYVTDSREQGIKVSVLSSDKDLMQLVQKGVLQFNPASETWFNAAAVAEKFGVGPELVADSLALSGDKSDGVAGIPGIGPKKAAALLREFGSLPELLSNVHLIKNDKQRALIEANAEVVRLARQLVSLDSAGCPRPFDISAATAPDPFSAGKAYEVWTETRLPDLGPMTDSPSP